MFVFHSVKRFAAGRRRNSRGQLMSCADVERVDAVVADAAADAAFFAAGALAVAAAVENGDVFTVSISNALKNEHSQL